MVGMQVLFMCLSSRHRAGVSSRGREGERRRALRPGRHGRRGRAGCRRGRLVCAAKEAGHRQRWRLEDRHIRIQPISKFGILCLQRGRHRVGGGRVRSHMAAGGCWAPTKPHSRALRPTAAPGGTTAPARRTWAGLVGQRLTERMLMKGVVIVASVTEPPCTPVICARDGRTGRAMGHARAGGVAR